MLDNSDDKNRQVIPRWRSFESAVQFGELQALDARPSDAFTDSMLNDLLEDWKREPGLSVACDVVSAAYAIGRTHAVRDVAQIVVDNEKAPPLARRIARRCLGDDESATREDAPTCGDGALSDIPTAIGATRRRLQGYPINPVLWTNLALLYTIRGTKEKALRAMRIAQSLAPANRFVIRSACRLFLHRDDVEQAHYVLLNSPSIRHDPWILSSEIAVAATQGHASQHMARAKRMVDARNHTPFHISELTAALATSEAHSGDIKRARQFCKIALTEPAENAVAQAIWLERKFKVNVRTASFSIDARSSEAAAWTALVSGNWQRSLSAAMQWQSEQPFSSRPANLGGYVATLQDAYAEAERMLSIGRAANRDDPMIANNLAFSLAYQNKVVEASAVLSDFSRRRFPAPLEMFLDATSGLVCFRSGQVEDGRRLYRRAVAIADHLGLADRAAIAKVFWAIEELRLGTSDCESRLLEARLALSAIPLPLATVYSAKLQKANDSLRSRSADREGARSVTGGV
jgi:tetratricopeptide (TPR) repeat protein